MRTLALLTLLLAVAGCDSGSTDDGDALLSGRYQGTGTPDNADEATFTFRFGDEGLAPGASEVPFSFNVVNGPTEDDRTFTRGVGGGGTARVTYGADGTFSFDCSSCMDLLDPDNFYPIRGSGTATPGRIELDLTGTVPTRDLVLTPQ